MFSRSVITSKYNILPIACIVCLCMLFTGMTGSNAYAEHVSEQQRQLKVKAAFILNLVRFSQWTKKDSDNQDNPLIFCLYQYNFLQDGLKSLEGKTIQKRQLMLRIVKDDKIPSACNVVLIPASQLQRFIENNEIQDLENKITITDLTLNQSLPETLENKVIFRLIRNQLQLRFEVNETAANKLNIHIGSELLKLGNIINESDHLE